MEAIMKAVDVMVRDVITIGPDDTVADAARLIAQNDVSALPVVDEHGRVVGIVSEGDLMNREEIGTEIHHPWWIEAVTPAATLATEFAKCHGKRVAEVMSDDVVTATEDASLAEIAALLERNRIKRVPILRDGKLVGIVSRSNLVLALASNGAPAASSEDANRTIRNELLSRLAEQQDWTDFGSRNIIVADGKVHLWGLTSSDAERKALIALAEGVPGVKQVVDEMIPAY
jgi:CBS domain-containing protein